MAQAYRKSLREGDDFLYQERPSFQIILGTFYSTFLFRFFFLSYWNIIFLVCFSISFLAVTCDERSALVSSNNYILLRANGVLTSTASCFCVHHKKWDMFELLWHSVNNSSLGYLIYRRDHYVDWCNREYSWYPYKFDIREARYVTSSGQPGRNRQKERNASAEHGLPDIFIEFVEKTCCRYQHPL